MAAQRWFWPLIIAATSFTAIAAALAALALVNPVERAGFEGQAGSIECLTTCFALADPEPFGRSDAVLLFSAGVSLALGGASFVLARRSR